MRKEEVPLVYELTGYTKLINMKTTIGHNTSGVEDSGYKYAGNILMGNGIIA